MPLRLAEPVEIAGQAVIGLGMVEPVVSVGQVVMGSHNGGASGDRGADGDGSKYKWGRWHDHQLLLPHFLRRV